MVKQRSNVAENIRYNPKSLLFLNRYASMPVPPVHNFMRLIVIVLHDHSLTMQYEARQIVSKDLCISRNTRPSEVFNFVAFVVLVADSARHPLLCASSICYRRY